ncbi:hypothetical protein SNEBB_004423 [Seison nebaliae]|nr:hypothetical protein SNEBB_004423 [Seison nebaliae]
MNRFLSNCLVRDVQRPSAISFVGVLGSWQSCRYNGNYRFLKMREIKSHDGTSSPLSGEKTEIHAFHLVRRVKQMHGEPWWVKDSMSVLGWDHKTERRMKRLEFKSLTNFQVIPNTPEMNRHLWMCKHLLDIQPYDDDDDGNVEMEINDDELDERSFAMKLSREKKRRRRPWVSNDEPVIDSVMMEENVKLNSKKNIRIVNGIPVACDDIDMRSNWKVDQSLIDRRLSRKRWMRQLNAEYFPTEMEWKYSQDIPGTVMLSGRPNKT